MTRTHEIEIEVSGVTLHGTYSEPDDVKGVVLFSHGSGSSRFSPRNRYVAERLNDRNLATLLVDLLTPEEEEKDRQRGVYRFDIRLLAHRLINLVDWLHARRSVEDSGIGLLGASTGAGAAVIAGALRPALVSAVVSRGGRPDLAGRFLQELEAPTLLIVGERDRIVLGMNREAMQHLRCPRRLEIVPGAPRLFKEPEALERVSEVAELAGEFFEEKLQRKSDTCGKVIPARGRPTSERIATVSRAGSFPDRYTMNR